MFEIRWDKKALEELEKLETIVAKRIAKKVDELKEDPFSKNIEKMKGEKGFKLRVGNYRALFEMEKDIIMVLKVGHRKDINKK